jgi:hypothetical protein
VPGPRRHPRLRPTNRSGGVSRRARRPVGPTRRRCLYTRGRRHLPAAGILAVVAACALPPPEPAPVAPPATDIETTFFLIGDAGAPDPSGDPVLRALQADLSTSPATAMAVFLGDNIYPRGMPPVGAPDRQEAERRLSIQIDAVLASGARAVFIPGNHDWNYGGDDGRQRVRAEEAFGTERGQGHAQFLPGNACPGPESLDIGAHARLVVIDTHWWMREAFDSAAALADCPTPSREAVLDSLSSLLDAGGRTVIVAGHHPIETYGTHGGFFTFRQHVFPLTEVKPWLWVPLPIIGSAYPIVRRLGISNQDISGSRYERMRAELDSVFRTAPPLVYASGHEHTIQVLQAAGARYQVVSGSGYFGHASPVTRGAGTLYHTAGRSGYVRLDVQRDGRIRLAVLVVDRNARRSEPWSMYLE